MIVYLATTKKRRTVITWHLVWDFKKFLAARRAEGKKEGATVSEATHAEYLEFRHGTK